MSYDVHLEADLGGPEPITFGDWNCTSNLARMWCDAGADLRTFNGQPAGWCAEKLRAALRILRDDPGHFQAMDPPNGWGSYADLLPALDRLLEMFENAPKATVRVGW